MAKGVTNIVARIAKPISRSQLVVAISSRALFDLESENMVFEQKGDKAYQRLQLEKIDCPAPKGIAFDLAHKLLSFNTESDKRVEVIVLSRNDPVSGLRVFKSAEHHGLAISRGAFVRGTSPYPYLRALKADLFLSANAEDVRGALEQGIPSARVFARSSSQTGAFPDELRIAFDGDAVLFSDEAERVFREGHLSAFQAHEKDKALVPLPAGPIEPFFRALLSLKSNPPEGVKTQIRTALVTARDAPAHERALRTLLSWDVEIDEAFFLGGLPKEDVLKVFHPDFFFDDQLRNCEPSAPFLPTGHVVSGIANEPNL